MIDHHTACPFCYSRIKSARDPFAQSAVVPLDGDIAVCLCCGGISVFDVGSYTLLRRPTRREKLGIADNPRVQRLITQRRQ